MLKEMTQFNEFFKLLKPAGMLMRQSVLELSYLWLLDDDDNENDDNDDDYDNDDDASEHWTNQHFMMVINFCNSSGLCFCVYLP